MKNDNLSLAAGSMKQQQVPSRPRTHGWLWSAVRTATTTALLLLALLLMTRAEIEKIIIIEAGRAISLAADVLVDQQRAIDKAVSRGLEQYGSGMPSDSSANRSYSAPRFTASAGGLAFDSGRTGMTDYTTRASFVASRQQPGPDARSDRAASTTDPVGGWGFFIAAMAGIFGLVTIGLWLAD